MQGLQGRNLTYQWLKNNVAIPGATSPDYSTSVLGSYSLEVTNTLNFKDTSDIYLLGSYLNLISFTAQKISAGIVGLKWSTASEQNISGYTLQKRKDNEAVFSDLAFIPDKSVNGFSGVQLDYLFNDSSAVYFRRVFYRLQIHHTDNSTTYSDVLVITSDNTKNGFTLFPNPAKGHAQLYLNEFSQPLAMYIYDGAGKRIMEQQLNQQNTSLTLPASKGIYIIQVSDKDGNNKVRKKLVVL